jgi:hypothetical protein
MKKIIYSTLITLIFFLNSVGFVSAYAIDCGESCANGYYKSSISGTGLCECVINTNSEEPEDLRVTSETLDKFDPLKTEGSEHAGQLSTPGGIISRVLDFAFPLAGMILFVMIVIGGLQMLTSAGNDKGLQAGQQRVTMAVVGFLLLFASYWIAQILQELLNIQIL